MLCVHLHEKLAGKYFCLVCIYITAGMMRYIMAVVSSLYCGGGVRCGDLRDTTAKKDW